jgi:hypothetical protein
MSGELTVKIESDVDNYTFEVLEDKIRDLLESEGLMGDIEDKVTGNITRTRREELGIKKDLSDENVKGVLTLGEKIWFNDDLRCRLRICGWTKEQQEKLKNAKFVDLTLTDFKDEDTHGVIVHISQFVDKDRGDAL